MTSSASTIEKTFHVRSISLPSRAHPTTLRVEEELQSLKTCLESSFPVISFTKLLADLDDGVEDLLHLPSIRQGLLHSGQINLLEKDVDGSLRLLDLCNTIKDAIATSKQNVQDLQFALRRKDDSLTKVKVETCIRSRKETQKMIKKSYKDLTSMDGKCDLASMIPRDSNASMIMKVLEEARITTRSLLCSVTSSMFVPKAKATGWWSFSSKAAMRETSEDDLCKLLTTLKDADAAKLMMTQKQLQTIDRNFGDLENGLECLFRRLIRNRVSLLNILSL
ncbi:hypothetical protein Cni_G15990 [Canna indica]|uniref:Uncharacterized protein n=1 Tax=Canna indica TaxID=4628 RepID=A0AAQ3QC69_9LILI|nr:hypothetical protein Cni_G15990 [Canna indica]